MVHILYTCSSCQSISLIRLLVAIGLGPTLPPLLLNGTCSVLPPLLSCIDVFHHAWRYEMLILYVQFYVWVWGVLRGLIACYEITDCYRFFVHRKFLVLV